ncbi:CPBP family intramembrane glutamic endopeptidase [uncultured Thiohalocapsa sp.]|uniref:CPBP family intramembrane glutamic endopeptidase n=1 Tax=uncultured Thiohalocapsa sp. TaxID=768990 RepID=UPI0025E00D3E|nr:CPBP family intramembrane glutamic endopeptidase [uncultured Thiohalocapsa sp.]
MRTTALFFAYLFCCLVLAAATAPPLMETGLIDEPPRRVMGRLAQLYILLGLWPFLKLLRLDNRAALGFGIPRRRFLRDVALGWMLGVAILALLVWALLALRVRVPDVPADGLLWYMIEKAIAALIGGLLIGLLEELFFRGALYGAIRRRGGIRAAVVWSALLYALLHFMKPHDLPAGVAFDWAGSWAMFAGVFTGLADWRHLDSMLALFLVGVFLALVRERSGHIAWGIGLHAGWVFVIQLSRRLSDGNEAAAFAYLTGDYDGVIGLLAAAWIGVLALAFWGITGLWRRRAVPTAWTGAAARGRRSTSRA